MKSGTSKNQLNIPIATNFEIESLGSKNHSENFSKKLQNGSFNSYKIARVTDKTDADKNTLSPTSTSNQASQFKVKSVNKKIPIPRCLWVGILWGHWSTPRRRSPLNR